MESIRLGIAGTGDIAALHAAGARAAGLELGVAAGHDPQRARALAEGNGARLYESYEALLADPAVDAVDLCVPNHRHRPFAEAAFAAGKHVLCEKPIALTLEDADAMIDAARRAGKTLMVAHALRYWPEYRLTHDLYRRGELGDGGWFSARRLTSVLYATQGAQGWRADPARAGGAALDLQIHDLDFVCWLFGPPQAVFAHGLRLAGGGRGVGPQAGGPGGGWEHLATTLRYADGRGATVESSFILPPGDPFEISFRLLSGPYSLTYRYSPPDFALHGLHGEEERPGAAGGPTGPGAAEGGAAPSLLLYRDGQDSRVLARSEVDSFPAAIAAEIADFARCLRTGEAPACDGEAARLALAVALASLQSCETGRAVELPELLA